MPGLIAHEWIEPFGGSENVLEAIAAEFPDAPILTPWLNAPERFPGREVRELWLARSPLRGRKALAMPVLAGAWRTAIDPTEELDWVIASSHSFAHHLHPRGRSRDAAKLVYTYTPARYLWTPELDDRGSGPLARAAARALRPIDRARASEATAIAGISNYVAERIAATWEQPASVIYPPVEISRIQSVADWRSRLGDDGLRVMDSLPETFVLGASRFIPYKRLDLVIAAGESAGLPVVLAGAGPEEPRLRTLAEAARVPVTFVIEPPNELLYALYAAATVLVFPPVEDFGIMPIEAMALGTPVAANRIGGSAETVAEGISGVHFDADDPASVADAVRRASDLPREPIVEWSRRFSRERFSAELREWVAANA
ncbi:glycosyltransferase involved in cell wall biosynthesis [Microbacteriaceae bacterium SG_E_30_P1]|uniref:Glycosyltransferase involved in cell wall biosynthesis n=1 Tax=Antiquaquibacter oligotrophicus TaxID=2880260 RepID=A0ABT6KNW3_9MICO|nr:glycosyltransferase [Antiquaquibacter oligotrophicus]MDH6181694.1 glycosyltransferase involved in cell wall biosynthesis [Antiquaquibacter oligotrophicus]UDF12622.1 glycosyltransferase [Antiquaquibacter oligotrophicus]